MDIPPIITAISLFFTFYPQFTRDNAACKKGVLGGILFELEG